MRRRLEGDFKRDGGGVASVDASAASGEGDAGAVPAGSAPYEGAEGGRSLKEGARLRRRLEGDLEREGGGDASVDAGAASA